MKASALSKLPTTPFPNALLDQVMPILKDTEWRVVCVIVRQTLGWKDAETGGRKISDWLTQRQLIQRTGRSSEAISRSLDTLVRKEVIEVRNRAGRCLATPAQRRQSRGHLEFSLSRRFRDGKRDSPMESPWSAPIISHANSPLLAPNEKIEFGTVAKANRTKENTKETVTKNATKLIAFVEQFGEQYSANGHGTLGPPNESTIKSLSAILDRHSSEELSALRDTFFECRIKTVLRNGWSLDSFATCVNLLVLVRQAHEKPLPAGADGRPI